MNRAVIENIANAVLYEGYMLYPYRASSIKNQQRFNFGVLYPEGYDTSSQTTECLVRDEGGARVTVLVRYLRLDASQQAQENEVEVADLSVRQLAAEPRNEASGIGAIRISALEIANRCYKLTVEIRNTNRVTTETRREAVLCDSMISVHTILSVRGGTFPSLLDPPADLARAASECRNVGVWPVLAGEEGSNDAVLSSPIILYDYPQIAPESPQNLFDGAEIDEILTLRIMTLSDDEKAEIRQGDERTRKLLEAAENIPPEQLMKLHGALRGLPARDKTVKVFGTQLKKGDHVRLWPQKSADIMDIALKGKTATIEAIEEDFEGNIHFAVVVDDDPGRDLGELRQPGHRFFFGAEEVEPLALDAVEAKQ
jgi:hypothetical protein